MSLLMQALKKAELNKQAGQEVPNNVDSLQLEPIHADVVAAEAGPQGAASATLSELPKLSERSDSSELAEPMEALDAGYIEHAESPKVRTAEMREAPTHEAPAAAGSAAAPGAAKPRQEVSEPVVASVRETSPGTPSAADADADAEDSDVRQVFVARPPPRGRKGLAMAIALSAAALCVAGIGGYFWWRIQPGTGLAVTMRATPPLAMAPPLPTPLLASDAGAAHAAPQTTYRREDDGNDEIRGPWREAPRQPAPPLPNIPDSPIRISKTRMAGNPGISRGFDALNAGDLTTAMDEYRRVLQPEPGNGDALRGMAAIALRQGNPGGAADWYLRAIEANPKDAAAQAGLIGLRGHGDPGDSIALESRLKTLIAAQPDVAALHFALGNIHARQNRWGDAQQEFFQAFSAEPEHPDHAFNLAVSLDHLRQTRLAVEYYGRALELAEQRPAGFDRTQAATRLRELRQ